MSPMEEPYTKEGDKQNGVISWEFNGLWCLSSGDGKTMSVSRRKVLCHEEIYATFDATKGKAPVAEIEAFKMDLDNVKGEMEGLNKIGEFKKLYNIPDRVLSVKFLDDYRRNPEFNEASPADPPRKMIEAISPQSKVQGENPVENRRDELGPVDGGDEQGKRKP
jgi:hypothetical protein